MDGSDSSAPASPPTDVQPWHAEAAEAALARAKSTLQGLDESEAVRRLQQHGPNVIARQAARGPLALLAGQINNPLIWVLIASGGLAILMGKLADGAVVLGVVVINTIIGFVQEYRAGQAIEALMGMVPDNATVRRGGQSITVPVAQLVPGDIVSMASGDRVPADLRLVAIRNLRIDEAALTGESLPVDKQLAAVPSEAAIGDRTCMAFGGTMVSYGTGSGVVVGTGRTTELGRISEMLQQAVELDTPLTKALATIARYLTIAIVVVAVVLMVVGLWRGYPLADAVLVAIALAVGAIPEGLPAIVTISLAIGVRRMAARRAIIRKLPAVETLGSTTVICSDKTGTLTRNEMTVQALWTPAGGYGLTGVGYEPVGALERDGATLADAPPDVTELVRAAALCNDAALRPDGESWRATGDPTEIALVVAAEKLAVEVPALRDEEQRLDAIPFESENQYMVTLHDGPSSRWMLMKGAPEAVMKRSVVPEDCERCDVLDEAERMARQGMRVLVVARKAGDPGRSSLEAADVESGFTFLGLLGMIDPPRPEAIEAVAACHQAGVTVKMITGDHKATAQAIGEQLGLAGESPAIGGPQLASMSEAEIQQAAVSSNVFARVAPEHKLQLVRALQEQGQIVAMTGDGVNDAPALKQANIGVSMGVAGTAVAKEASDMVLADDNFASIAAAVEEGRRVFDNLVKALAFVLPTNIGLALILIYSVLFFPIRQVGADTTPLQPLLPTQLLWINLVAAVALALPLAFEPAERDVMRRPPRTPDEPVLSSFVVQRTVLAAVLMTAGAVGLFSWEYYRELPRLGHELAMSRAQTMAVTTVIAYQIFYMLSCRSLRETIFAVGLLGNATVFVGIGTVLALQLGFIYVPVMQTVFGSRPLDAKALAISIAAGAVILPVIAFEQWLRKLLASRGSASRA